MIRVKCAHCGEMVDIDEKNSSNALCPICGNQVFLPENVEKKQDEKEKKLAETLENYKASGSSAEAKAVVAAWEQYRNGPDFNERWKKFIIGLAGIALEKDDRAFCKYLKTHAKAFDDGIKNGKIEGEGIDLYYSLITACPDIAVAGEWGGLIKATRGDDNKRSALIECVLKYVKDSKSRAAAIDVFYMLAAGNAENADIVRSFLSSLCDDAYVAESVFPVKGFNGKARKFIKKAKKYRDNYLTGENTYTIEETQVYKNYEASCKKSRRHRLIAIAAVVVVAVIAVCSVLGWRSCTNSETVSFAYVTENGTKALQGQHFEIVYGDELPLPNFKYTYKTNDGEEHTEVVKSSMLSGYDKETVGTQQTVTVTYNDVKATFTVNIKPATLTTPVLSLSGSDVTWGSVANAAGYEIYVNETALKKDSVAQGTLSYSLYDNDTLAVLYGELSVYLKAKADDTGKYSDSALSEKLTVTKLQQVSNVRYSDGTLTWDAASGAEKYELTIDEGTPVGVTTNSYEVALTLGSHRVTIVAEKNDGSAISSILKNAEFTYSKLSPVTSVTYSNNKISWDAPTGATSYTISVDDEKWKTNLNRTNFSTDASDTDGFTYGDGKRKITIVANSNQVGVESSESASFMVSVGNHITLNSDKTQLEWASEGSGATYTFKLNGESVDLSTPYQLCSQMEIKEGDNSVSVTVSVDNETIILESITLVKNAKPTFNITGTGTLTSDGNTNNRYKVNDGEWSSELPDTSTFAAGTSYTIKAKRLATASLELDSDEVTISVVKPQTPVISMKSGRLVCSNEQGYTIKYYKVDSTGGNNPTNLDGGLSSLTGSTTGDTTYYIEIKLVGSGQSSNESFVLDSDYSNVVEVIKLATPTMVAYEQGDTVVKAKIAGEETTSALIKFYYEQDGEEKELSGGKIENLPKGSFTIYARQTFSESDDNKLTSDSTESDYRTTVFNLDVELTIGRTGLASGVYRQLKAAFSGCADISSLTFTYKFEYYSSDGTLIGTYEQTAAQTISKAEGEESSDTIITTYNIFNVDVVFESGYTKTDIYQVGMTAYIESGDENVVVSAENKITVR